MKTITGIILVVTMLTSCIGEPGPPGIDGLDGKDGDSFLGSVFEIEGDFTSQNDYAIFFEFPETLEIYESDVVLVYLLWEQTEDNNGSPVDIWRMLPQTIVINDKILQYNYDYTVFDVKLFLEGTIPFEELLPAETDNQIFRIVVLPADFVAKTDQDLTDFNGLMKSLKIRPEKMPEKGTGAVDQKNINY